VAASAAYVGELAAKETALGDLAALLNASLAAALAEAAAFVLGRIDEVAAHTHDVALMLDALPPLVHVRRYGDVRGTDVTHAGTTLDTLLKRACVGLPGAMRALDDEAAAAAFGRLSETDAALRLLEDAAHAAAWCGALRQVAADERVHGVVAGRAMRLLFDASVVGADDVRVRLSRALSRGTPPAAAAAWIDGLLRGSGTLLLHDQELLGILDEWLVGLDDDTFLETLPLVRRTFATFAPAERRAMGERLRAVRGAAAHGLSSAAGSPAAGIASPAGDIDEARARLVMPVLRLILGPEAKT
jgi:hypothetical protein